MGQRFRNTYGRTKPEAEHAVHESGLPAAIVRPSIVVGDSASGWTPTFNVIYWPLQAFARGLFPTVPADPAAHVDIVPVDVVADTLVELLRGPMRTGTFHVVSGDNAPTAGALARGGQWGKQTLPRWSAERQALQHVACASQPRAWRRDPTGGHDRQGGVRLSRDVRA